MSPKRVCSCLKKQFKEYFFESEFWNAVLLIVGTCLGGGITILPSVMAEQGCLVGIAVLTLSALFAIASSLLLLEVFFSLKEPIHFFTLFEKKLPSSLHVVAILIYVFICFSSIVAYISGISSELLSLHFPGHTLGCFFVTFCGIFLFSLSRKSLININSDLTRILFFCFFFLLLYMARLFQWESIVWVKKISFLPSFPICLTAFSHQMMIPSLQTVYQKSMLRPVICVGIFITWSIYVCWILFSFGTLPFEGPNSLLESYQNGTPMTLSLIHLVDSQVLALLSSLFSILVLFTSFIGVTLSLFDFISESFGNHFQKWLKGMSFIVLLPSCFFAFLIPKVFLYALDLSGGLGDATLYGLFPAYLIFSGARNHFLAMNPLHWISACFILTVGCLSLVLECKYLFFG